ncbi:DUF2732 family protein [Yersinia aleksiciae]|uniref:Transcriptional regulator n=1 Tax=Yersinia aleksiciae TaxID=263819 RepID=A0ABN4H102_YERAE|nr:DUF2732 family protein [Yersinia aleksiciae]AKP32142.1 transcriptional regulator [Yersinia aleksiciae]CFQ34317.1 Protein of uncharacterised function (DUF2732) [Yersinia aleksiciae]
MLSEKVSKADLVNETRLNEHRKQAALTSELLEKLANVIVVRNLCIKESVELLRQESDNIKNQINE